MDEQLAFPGLGRLSPLGIVRELEGDQTEAVTWAERYQNRG